jgi:hypothetical protein
MQDAYLTISTTVDGKESRMSCKAELALAPTSAVLRYQDENASVSLTLNGDSLTIERMGDYGLYLPLTENAYTVGRLSIAGQDGDVKIYTKRLAYTIGKSSLLLQLFYTLFFGEEKQEMRLRIRASQNHSEEK